MKPVLVTDRSASGLIDPSILHTCSFTFSIQRLQNF
jgi:hypothetical protein